MRKLLLTLCLLAATLGFAQSPGITVTGTLRDAQGNPNAGTVTLTLANHGAGPATVGGTYAILSDSVSAQAASDGTFSVSVYGNYQLDQHGTYYSLAFYPAGSRAPISTARYVFTVPGSFNVSALVPYTSSPSGPVATPGYMTSAGAATISGLWAFSTSPTVPDPTTNFQVANKEYVDSHAGGVSLSGTNNWTGQQSFTQYIQVGTGSSTSTVAPGQGVWNRRGVVIYPDPTLANPYTTGEPTVIVEANPVVLTGISLARVWKMWYTVGHFIYYAESADGVNWTTYVGPGTNPVGNLFLANTNYSQSFVIKNGSTYHMYANNRSTGIDHLTSTDGVTWTLANANVLTNGTFTFTNSSGIVIGGTFYWFVETGGFIQLYTSTDFATFTSLGSVAPTGSKGPSVPVQVNGQWYMWVHNSNNVGTGDAIYRLTAPAITGPWTAAFTQPEFFPQTLGEGVQMPNAQTADPYLLEVDGKTYMFYSSAYIDAAHGYSQVKLAVADMPFSSLVLTQGGDSAGVENIGASGCTYSFADTSLDCGNRSFKNVTNESLKTLNVNFNGAVAGDIHANGANTLYIANAASKEIYTNQLGVGTSGASYINNSGKLSKYLGTNTTAGGLSAIYGVSHLTLQGAAIAATTIYAVPSTGVGSYRVCYSTSVTRAGSVSSTLGGTNGFQVIYTDSSDSTVKTTIPGPTTSANTTGTAMGNCVQVYAKASTNIQYSMGYTDGGGTSMQYDLHITVEGLGN
jgi:hypothetical protein